MEKDPKIFTASDLGELNQFNIGVIIDQMQEMSYRKGCHQTASMVFDAVKKLKTKEDIMNFLGTLEDVLVNIRGDSSPHPGLLHEAIRRAVESISATSLS